MTIAQRAIRNAIDLLSNLSVEEAKTLGEEFYQQMGLQDTYDVLSDLEVVIAGVKHGAQDAQSKA